MNRKITSGSKAAPPLIGLASILLCIFTASAVESASTRDMQQYFAGKTITIIVGSSAGGGADYNARLFARYASKHFPGKPNFIVQNLPGSDQLRGLQAGMRARPNGLTAASLNARWAIQSILGEDLGPRTTLRRSEDNGRRGRFTRDRIASGSAEDVYQAWVKGYATTIQDPELVETAVKGGHEIQLGHAEDFIKTINLTKTLSPNGLALFKKLMVAQK